MNILTEIIKQVDEFNLINNENFAIDSIRAEFSKEYKLDQLKRLGNWNKINKNDQKIYEKLAKRKLTKSEISSAYKLENYNIYYYNKSDKQKRKYRKAEMVIFGLKQYHKPPPPKELVFEIMRILKNVSNIDLCCDDNQAPNINNLKRYYQLTPHFTTHYINNTNIDMIEKITIYDKQNKNNLDFQVWRYEAKVIIPNPKYLMIPFADFQEIINYGRAKNDNY